MDGVYILKTFTSWYSIGLNRLASEENYKVDSESPDVYDVFDDLKEYTLNDTKTLWIDRSTCQVSESLVPLTEDEPISENLIDAFLGIVEVMNTYHLGVVTRSEVVAELDLGSLGLNRRRKSKIMTIKEVKFLPIRSHQEVTYGSEEAFSFDTAMNQFSPGTSPSTSIMGSSNLPNLATMMNSNNGLGDPGYYQMQEEVFKVLENMEKIMTTGYYYSYDTDLTNTMQSLYLEGRVPLRRMMSGGGKASEEELLTSLSKQSKSPGREDEHGRKADSLEGRDGEYEEREGRKELLNEIMERNKTLYEVSKRDFNWGHKISQVLPRRWKTVLVQGYVGYRISYLNEEKMETLIIGRRNVKRSGTRFLARGIDEKGNVGNFVETEVRVRVNEEKWYAYTQHRGSVPVFWEQMNVTAPVLLYNYHHNIRSFKKHVEVLNEYYRPNEYQLYVNLLDVKENEKVLTDAFMNVVDDYNRAQGCEQRKVRERKGEGSSSRVEGESSEVGECGLEEREEDEVGKRRNKVGMIELVNYNYNVNAKWNTHEIIIKYILEELNHEFNKIGYFDEEKYLESSERKGAPGRDRRKNHGEISESSSVVGSVSSKRSSRVGSGSESVDSSSSSSSSHSRDESGQDTSAEELDRVPEETRGELGEDRRTSAENKRGKGEQRSRSGKRDGTESGEEREKLSRGTRRSKRDRELEGKRGLQRGIVRTNCLDCLDRTNIFQWMSSWVVVNKILNNRMTSSTGGTSILVKSAEEDLLEEGSTTEGNFSRLKEMLLTPEGGTREESTLFTAFTDLWCDHGDAISIHYSGTPSTLSERVKQTNTSLNSLFHYSKTMVQRLYHSLFQDNQRQAVFNILSPYTATSTGTGQREQEDLLLLDPADGEGKEPEQERPVPEKPEGRHFSRATGVASRVVQKVDQVVRGARERRLLNTKYYIQDPFNAENSREGASFTSGHETTASAGRGFEVPYSSDSDTYTDSGRASQSRGQGTRYQGARSALGASERGKQQAQGTTESSDSIFDKLQKEIMSKLTIKSPVLAPTDLGTKGVPDLKLLKQQREQLEEEYEEVEDLAEELEENLLKAEFARKSLDQLKIWVGSWNIGAHAVDVNQDVLDWMDLKRVECDLYVFSFQEFVELNFINIATGRTDENKEYEFEYFVENMFKLSTSHGFEKVTSISMTGLYLVIFVKRSLKPHIRDLLITNVKTGLNYNIGNKGSVGIQFNLFDYTLSFLNIHLNFGKNLNVGRIELLEYILKNAFKEFNKNVLDNDIFILGGDFNFHVQLEKQVVLNLLKKMEYAKLLNYDEFNMAKMIGIPVMNRLHEASIQFQPTYKYKDGTRYYTTKRSPAWCDRIIFGGRLFESRKINILSYKRNDNLMISDHRPVSSIILVDLK